MIAFANISNANAQQVNAKILEVYGDKTQELVINDPIRLDFLNDLLNNRIKIIESPLSDNNEKEQTLDLKRFNESLKGFSTAKDALSGKEISLSSNNLTVSAKSPLVLELN